MRGKLNATMGKLHKQRRNLGGNGAESYFTAHTEPDTVAIDSDLDPAVAEGREVEAEGYHRKRPPKGGRKWGFRQKHPYDFDPNAINSIRCVIDELRPSWVEEVRDAARISNDPRWIAAWCEISPQVVVAILLNLDSHNQLPDTD